MHWYQTRIDSKPDQSLWHKRNRRLTVRLNCARAKPRVFYDQQVILSSSEANSQVKDRPGPFDIVGFFLVVGCIFDIC